MAKNGASGHQCRLVVSAGEDSALAKSASAHCHEPSFIVLELVESVNHELETLAVGWCADVLKSSAPDRPERTERSPSRTVVRA